MFEILAIALLVYVLFKYGPGAAFVLVFLYYLAVILLIGGVIFSFIMIGSGVDYHFVIGVWAIGLIIFSFLIAKWTEKE